MLYTEHTNDFFCFPLSKSLINMLYIEHTNEYMEHGYGYGLPSPVMTSNVNLVSQYSSLPLPRGRCPNKLKRTYTHLQGFQLVCFGIQPRLDRRLPTTRYFVEFSLEFCFFSLCSILFTVVGFWKRALLSNSSPKHSDVSTLSSSSSSAYWLIAGANKP